MTYKTKRTLTSIVAGILLTIAYGAYALSHHAPATDNLQAWATLMLIFIGMGVGALVMIQILFHVGYSIGIAVKKRDEQNVERILSSAMVEDEMDSLIGLKAMRAGYICMGIGFVATLTALALGLSIVAALHILLGSMLLGSILEGCFSVYHYERGIGRE